MPATKPSIAMKLQEKIPLAPLTTIGLGGRARYIIECSSVAHIKEALQHARSAGLPVHILGGGSNTIFSDEGFPGLVIKINLKGIEWHETDKDVVVAAAAGEPWDDFVRQTLEQGLSGIECLSGIPGSVGATPMQNVGAYGQEVAQTIEEVQTLARKTLAPRMFTRAECNFSYRASRFKYEDKDKYIITHVTYRLSKEAPPAVRYQEVEDALRQKRIDFDTMPSRREALLAVRAVVIALRERKSMVIRSDDPHCRSCGSFFLNPIIPEPAFQALQARLQKEGSPPLPAAAYPTNDGWKLSAAWLIEQAGYKRGLRRGRVGISPNHTLALVNYGGTGKEILALAREIQTAVKKKFNITLKPEPVVVNIRQT